MRALQRIGKGGRRRSVVHNVGGNNKSITQTKFIAVRHTQTHRLAHHGPITRPIVCVNRKGDCEYGEKVERLGFRPLRPMYSQTLPYVY